MKNYEQEVYMMLVEDTERLSEDFPVKSNNRAARRLSTAEHIRKRYGNARGEEGKRSAIIAHRVARQNRLTWEARKFVVILNESKERR